MLQGLLGFLSLGLMACGELPPAEPMAASSPSALVVPPNRIASRVVFSEADVRLGIEQRVLRSAKQVDDLLSLLNLNRSNRHGQLLRLNFSAEVGVLYSLPPEGHERVALELVFLDPLGASDIRVQPLRRILGEGNGVAGEGRPTTYVALPKTEADFDFLPPLDVAATSAALP